MGLRVATIALLAAPLTVPVLAQEFSASPFFLFELEGNFTADVTLADIDGDGDLDVFAANGRHWAQPDFVYLNNGDGRLLEGRPIGSGRSASYTIRAIDLDRDGDLDAVVVRDQLPIQIFHNDGSGHFAFVGNVEGSGGAARGAITLDGNGDGIDDLLVFRRRGSNLFFSGDGAGAFETGVSIGADGFGATGGAAGDLDGDGDIDVVVARRDGNVSLVLDSDGAGNFMAGPLARSLGDFRKAEIADFDADGHLDIVIGGRDGMLLFAGQGALAYAEPRRIGTPTLAVQALAAADVDRDGDIDLVAGVDGPNRLFVNLGDNEFSEQDLPRGEGDTYGIAIGDLDGDGLDDIAIANSGSENAILRQRRNN